MREFDSLRRSVEEVRRMLAVSAPRLLVVTGKTCTGKSTFSGELSALGYRHVELDSLVRCEIAGRLGCENRPAAFSVYGGAAPVAWQRGFEQSAGAAINQALSESPVVVDTAIRDPGVFARILSGTCLSAVYLFFHPFDGGLHLQRLEKRLLLDLKRVTRRFDFWDQLSEEVIQELQTSQRLGPEVHARLEAYRDESVLSSEARFWLLRKAFPSIVLTGY